MPQTGTTDFDAVRQAMCGHHLSSLVLLGEIREDGKFETVSGDRGRGRGRRWSDYIVECAKLTRGLGLSLGPRNSDPPKFDPS